MSPPHWPTFQMSGQGREGREGRDGVMGPESMSRERRGLAIEPSWPRLESSAGTGVGCAAQTIS